jgi:hypothetical protein
MNSKITNSWQEKTCNRYFTTAKINRVHLTGATYGRDALKFSWLTCVFLRDLFTGVLSLKRQQQRWIMSCCTAPQYATREVYSICYTSNKSKWLLSVGKKAWGSHWKKIDFSIMYHEPRSNIRHYLTQCSLSWYSALPRIPTKRIIFYNIL